MHIYTYIYTYIYINVHIHIYINVHILGIYIYVHVCIHIYMRICMYMYVYAGLFWIANNLMILQSEAPMHLQQFCEFWNLKIDWDLLYSCNDPNNTVTYVTYGTPTFHGRCGGGDVLARLVSCVAFYCETDAEMATGPGDA